MLWWDKRTIGRTLICISHSSILFCILYIEALYREVQGSTTYFDHFAVALNYRTSYFLSFLQIFRVWDIQTLSLMQVFHDTQGVLRESQIFAMVFDNTHQTLIAGGYEKNMWLLIINRHAYMLDQNQQYLSDNLYI